MTETLNISQPSRQQISPKKRYAICGLSLRGMRHFVLPLLGKTGNPGGDDFSDISEVVGILDLDMARCQEFLKAHDLKIPCFTLEDGVDTMIAQTKPDVLLVAGPDFSHLEYILAGLRHDLEILTEKPMVISSQEARQVLKALDASNGKLTVTHNSRYGMTIRKVKELILAGKIGRITNIEFVHNLDTRHGASYFSRWNRERKKSGGLSVHKCVHDIDLLNWLTDSQPDTVFGFGALNYYGKEGAHKPVPQNGNAFTVPETKALCPYFQQNFASAGIEPTDPVFRIGDRTSYGAQYPEDRYIYDDVIDIEDTYAAVLRYESGALANYSCNFSAPWEGYVIGINGTQGRIEAVHRSTPDLQGGPPKKPEIDTVTVMPLFGGREDFSLEIPKGGHAGADPVLRHDIFIGLTEESRQLNLHASAYDGAVAVAASEAIWRSNAEDRPLRIRELLGDCYRKDKKRA